MLDFVLNLAWVLSLTAAGAGYLLWSANGIERDARSGK